MSTCYIIQLIINSAPVKGIGSSVYVIIVSSNIWYFKFVIRLYLSLKRFLFRIPHYCKVNFLQQKINPSGQRVVEAHYMSKELNLLYLTYMWGLSIKAQSFHDSWLINYVITHSFHNLFLKWSPIWFGFSEDFKYPFWISFFIWLNFTILIPKPTLFTLLILALNI